MAQSCFSRKHLHQTSHISAAALSLAPLFIFLTVFFLFFDATSFLWWKKKGVKKHQSLCCFSSFVYYFIHSFPVRSLYLPIFPHTPIRSSYSYRSAVPYSTFLFFFPLLSHTQKHTPTLLLGPVTQSRRLDTLFV